MICFFLGALLFFGVHCVGIFASGWRDRTIARLGRLPWRLAYSALSLIGLALLVYGYGLWRQEAALLFEPFAAGRHLAMLLMLPVFPLLLAAHLGGRIAAALRHPMLAAVCFWAAAHLAANHTAADVWLFGLFLAWALLSLLSFNWRSPAGAVRRTARPYADAAALIGGAALYALVLFYLHRPLTGIVLV